MIGYVSNEELAMLYKNALGFIYPSLEEGFGLPGLEAMANKTLLLASDIPVFKEIYKNHAIYFNPYDYSTIQRAIEKVLNMDKAEKSELLKNAADFAKKYSWESTAKETLAIYNRVA